MIRKVFFAIWLVATASCLMAAEEMTDTEAARRTVVLDEILITGTPLKDNPDTPNMTVVIPLPLLQGPESTLDAALKRQPGIDIQRPQEVGAALDDNSIRIRGFGSNRIVATIDGRPLNSPGTAGGYFIDWTTIPLNNVSEIQIIKGVSDPRYGNTLGGVVNLATKKPSSIPETEARVLGGSFGTETFGFYHGWKPGQFEYSISGGYSDSNGYLWNGDFWIKNASLYMGYNLPWDGKILGNVQYVEVKKGFIVNNRLSKDYDSPGYGVPRYHRYPASDGEIMYGGMGAYPEPGAWWKKEKYLYSVIYEQSFSNGFIDARYWQNYGNREAYNTRVSAGRIFHKEFYDDQSYGADSTFRYELPNNTITTGIDAKRFKDDGDKTLPGDFRYPLRNETYVSSDIWGAFLQDDIAFLERKLLITPGLRYTSFDGKPGPSGVAEGIPDLSLNGFAPYLKATYNYMKGALAYLSVARALRVPTLPEYYWHYSPDAGVYTGNLPFTKEDGIMVQGGWKAVFPTGTKLEISPYYYRIKDYIAFDLINFVSYNIDLATIYGVEVAVNQQLSTAFSLFGNFTYQKSKTKGDPFVANFVAPQDRNFDQIPALPEFKVNGGIQYKGPKKEMIAIYGSYISSQKVIYNNNTLNPPFLRIRTQDPYVVVDIEASYPLFKNFEITGYLYNLLNENYQERFGYPAVGINFGIGIRASL